MSTAEEQLNEISALVLTFKVEEGQRLMMGLLDNFEIAEIKRLDSEIRAVIALFFPKRRLHLLRVLEARVRRIPSPGEAKNALSPRPKDLSLTTSSESGKPFRESPAPNIVQPVSQSSTDKLGVSAVPLEPTSKREKSTSRRKHDNHAVSLARELRLKFVELSMEHIFEWKTFYRDAVEEMFGRVESALRDSSNPTDICYTVTREFSEHAQQIFGKGFTHLTENELRPATEATSKALKGFQRFLELPLESYSSRAINAITRRDAQAVRGTCSAMLTGILEGFGQMQFGKDRGWKLLPQHPRTWAHYLGFLTGSDIDRLETEIAASPLRDGIRASVTPVIRALDQIIADCENEAGYLPGLGQYNSDSRRLEISLLLPQSVESKRYLEVHCYLQPSHVGQAQLTESASRGAALITAPLRPDLQDWIDAHELLRTLVINTTPTRQSRIEEFAQRATEILRFEVARHSASNTLHATLKYNYPRDFPLRNPVLDTYFHVHRASVRNLLRSFDSRNGVRLWCSVRRSGKTTATSDLGDSVGNSVIVNQTMDDVGQHANAGMFAEAFGEALESAKQISSSFFKNTVARCCPQRQSLETRVVFVLDEYETLFARMGAALKRDRELRYTIVQPLLNQMVSFSRENLLVFIGQRPDAHFIIMDQNQLSPYVEQDPFPLFAHTVGATNSEFRNLLNKILTSRTSFDDSFVDATYAETGGHPWLTVNLLVDFFDWMIQEKRPVTTLHFTEEDLFNFGEQRLKTGWIGVCEEYALFREYISQVLSKYGEDWDPWLHAVYAVMRRIVQENPTTMACSRGRFEAIVNELLLPQEFGYEADYLLSTAAPANFLSFDQESVAPRIRLMARISLAAYPRVTA
jgi:hypothetical protein